MLAPDRDDGRELPRTTVSEMEANVLGVGDGLKAEMCSCNVGYSLVDG